MMDYKRSYREVIGDHFPEEMAIKFGKQELRYRKRRWKLNGDELGLRYGDNPGQEAALYELVSENIAIGECEYVKPSDGLISNLTEKELTETGKHIGKSNLTDVDAALNILKYFDEPTAVIVKHNNPSGVASRERIKDAYVEANFADRIAAFGGVLVVNAKIDKETAAEIVKNYLEVVAAPEFDKDAFDILTEKKNMRLMRIKKLEQLKSYRKKRVIEFKTLIDGGVIAQQSADNEVTRDTKAGCTSSAKSRQKKRLKTCFSAGKFFRESYQTPCSSQRTRQQLQYAQASRTESEQLSWQ